jgi:hypothetical protein
MTVTFNTCSPFVSATSMSVHAEVRGMPRPHVPNYALRRLMAGLVAAVAITTVTVVIAVGCIGVLAGFGGEPASASGASPALSSSGSSSGSFATVHVARPGDTLWSIASTYRGEVDHGRYVDALVRLNGGTAIQAGQAVHLP